MIVAASFTQAELSKLLNVSRQAVAKRLSGIPATGTKVIRGQEVSAWSPRSVPEKLRHALERLLKPGQSFDDLLLPPPAPFAPARPWKDIAGPFRDEALKRRDILADVMPLQHTKALTELHERILPAWQRGFGADAAKRFTVDRLRYVMDRATERDNGRHEWHRPELYLDAAALVVHTAAAESVAGFTRHKPLFDKLTELRHKAELTLDDKDIILDASWRHLLGLDATTEDRAAQLAHKRGLIDWLLATFPSPALAATPDALKTAFNRHRRNPTRDQRGNSGRKEYNCEPCRTTINHLSRQTQRHDSKGNFALAVRLAWKHDKFCARCREKFAGAFERDTLFVPHFLEAARPTKLEIAKDHGPNRVLSIGPHLTHDWSDIEPGEIFVMDDETPNHVVYDYVDKELVIGDAQNIECIDARSSYPIDFNLFIGAPNWLAVRRTQWQVATSFGLPDRDWLLEGGAFAARGVVGREDRDALTAIEVEDLLQQHFQIDVRVATDGEREMGIREAGPSVIRARSARGKSPIENHFLHTQKRESVLPGFRGFRARDEAPEWLEDFIRRCKNGKEDPASELLSLNELRLNYKEIREEWMHTKQPRSKRLRGASPSELMQERLARKPLRRLSREMDYILATHKRIMPLREQGITFDLSKWDKACYWSADLGKWYANRIKQVLVFQNIFDPSWITISDMKRRNMLRVPRQHLPVRTPKDQLADAMRNRRAYISNATSRFGNLTHPMISTVVRDDEYSADARALGEAHNAAVAQQAQEGNVEQREINQLRRRAKALGLEIEGHVNLDNARARQSLDLELTSKEREAGHTT